MHPNTLYYGDNLPLLREHIEDECVDLIYLDPPFNSQRDYNVIFREAKHRGAGGSAQIHAFEDTWQWGPEAEATLRFLSDSSEHRGRIPDRVATLIDALVRGVGRNDMTAYLVMMAVRLVELHRVLKSTGSLYLHCDPTSLHYLKVILDSIFGPTNFRNEIVWKRTSAHNDASQGLHRYGRVHDTLLFYTKTADNAWNQQYVAVSDEHLTEGYKRREPGTDRVYMEADLTANKPGGDTEYEWKGVRPYKGRYWAYSRANMEQFERERRLIYRRTGMPRLKVYLDESQGVGLQDVWTDIGPISAKSLERLGYPTQKPLALLERIIKSSSNEGDIILDPFCGCGTAIVAAQKLNRRWIGMDITHLAIAVMRSRLRDLFQLEHVPVIGEPVDLAGARALAAEESDGRYQFQWWALSLVDARPVGSERKKGADRGIDGVSTFVDRGGMNKILVSVKSGHVNVSQVRDLAGAVERDRAAMGLLITLEDATRPMRDEAVASGFYKSEVWGKDFPKIQVLTIAELLSDQRPNLPPSVSAGYDKAVPVKETSDTKKQVLLFGRDRER